MERKSGGREDGVRARDERVDRGQTGGKGHISKLSSRQQRDRT